MRKLLISVAVAAIAVALWHGVYIPVAWLQPVTGPLLADRAVTFKADNAVVSLLPTPKLRLFNAELGSTLTGQPLARAGLLTLQLHVSPGQARWLELHALSAKEAEIWIDQTGAEGSNWSAWPRVPPRSDRKLKLPAHISLENSFIYFKNESIGALSARIDLIRLLRDASAPSTMAIRIQHPDFSGNVQVKGLLQADDSSWQLQGVESEFTGRFAGYPWSLTGAIEALRSSDAGNATELSMSHLRLYAKRDDDPDEHQAVFSVISSQFHPADGRSLLRFAEWTYTHEKAEAWSFHAELDAALGRLKLLPATIPGSEAIPAQVLSVSVRCRESRQPVWVWHEGWFFWAEELRKLQKAQSSTPPASRTITCEP